MLAVGCCDKAWRSGLLRLTLRLQGVPLYEVTPTGLTKHEETGFAEIQLRERQDLQRLLRDDIAVLDADLLVIDEEFGRWEDARRRIDLLALDRQGRLVVIELKRTEDGGHMDLQALRYAAMVSAMVMDDVVQAHREFLSRAHPDSEVDPRKAIAEFLEIEDGEEPEIASDVRVYLVSANFGKEITNAVLWLNNFDGMDIRCVRLRPYSIEGRILLDVQQIVPLPEAADYQVAVKRKDRERRKAVNPEKYMRYRVVVDGNTLPAQNKRRAVLDMVAQLVSRGVAPERIAEVLGPRRFRGAPWDGDDLEELGREITAAYPAFTFDIGRWFTESPFRGSDATWLLTKMWGENTESALEELARSFPEARVSFKRADDRGAPDEAD